MLNVRRRAVDKLHIRNLILALALVVAALVGLRPAVACDDRIAGACKGAPILQSAEPVSYTHLTLPTIYSV